jgi:hypothetical protein
MNAPVKAQIKTETGSVIECLFNPSELTITKATQWNATKGKGKNTPKLRFQQGSSGTMTLALTLDTTDSGEPVTTHTEELLNLTKVDPSVRGANSSNNSARPPWCEFHWGDFHSFKAVVENLQIKFTYFASSGTPLRAQAQLTLKQYEDVESWALQNPTSGTPRPHAVHRIVPGETLDRVAARHYGDPTRWRLIADANEILDPLELEPGTALAIPEPEVMSRG